MKNKKIVLRSKFHKKFNNNELCFSQWQNTTDYITVLAFIVFRLWCGLVIMKSSNWNIYRVTALYVGKPPVTIGFPSQRDSNAINNLAFNNRHVILSQIATDWIIYSTTYSVEQQ